MSSSPTSTVPGIYKIVPPGDLKEIPTSIGDNVLHLDINSNKIISFPDRLHQLISLNISNNPITVSTLGNLQNLRSLSLDFCNIKKFKVFPNLPHLTHLSLVGNEITNLKDFPIYPNLNSIDFRGNPLVYDEYLLIAAIGSHNLSKLNNTKIQEKTFIKAFSISPIIGYSIRHGNQLTHQDDELDNAISFLTSESPLKIIDSGQTKSLVPPRGANSFKWYYLENSKWIDLDCPTRTLPITPFLSLKLIKCDFDGLSSYTATPVGWDEQGPVSFHNSFPEIIGDITSGAIIATNVAENTRITWKIGDKEIGNGNYCEIPEDSDGLTLSCISASVSNAFPNVNFAPIISVFTIQKPDYEFSEFSITENPEINSSLGIKIEAYPANSKFTVYIDIADDLASEFKNIASVEFPYEYLIPPDLAGKFIRISVNLGDDDFLYAYSKERVKGQGLKNIEATIVGSYKAGHPHILLFEDKEFGKKCKIEWLTLSDYGVYTNYSVTEPVFTPPIDAVNATICCHIIPDEDDTEYGETVVESPVPLGESSQLEEYNVEKAPYEGSKIEMDSEGQWQVSKGTELVDVDFSENFVPQQEQIGEYLRFYSDTKDVVFGVVEKSILKIKSVILETDGGDYSGALASISVNYYEEPVEYKVTWIRVLRGGDQKIAKEGGESYAITSEDVGCKIKARVSTQNESKDSNITPMIRAGLFKEKIMSSKIYVGQRLTVDADKGRVTFFKSIDGFNYTEIPTKRDLNLLWCDVDSFIRILVKNKKYIYYEDSVDRVLPTKVKTGDNLQVKDIFRKSDTRTNYRWYDQNDAIVSTENSYVVKKSDKSLTIVNENPSDKEDFELCNIQNIVSMDSPLSLELLPSGSLCIVGDLVSEEGEFFWRIWRDGFCDDIDNGGSPTLILLPAMIGSEIEGGWRANERDNVTWIPKKYYVARALPQPVAVMTEEDPLVVGSQLFVSTENSEHYSFKFEWKRWDGDQFIPIKGETNVHIIDEDDCDCYVCCDVRFVDKDGFLGPPFTVRTSEVVPPANYIAIEGRPVVGSLLAAVSNDDFVKKCRFEWQMLHDGFNWTVVSTRSKYRPVRDDVGAVVRIVGVFDDEQRFSAELGPIEDDSEEIQSAVQHAVKSGSLTMKAKDHKGDIFTVDIGKKSFTVKGGKFNSDTFSWRQSNNIVATPGSSRKIDVIINGNALSLLPTDTDPLDCDLKTYREFVLLVVATLKG